MMEDKKKLLPIWVMVAELLGIGILIMVGVWFGHFEGGFSWADNKIAFHVFFMVLGFVFLYGNAAMIYRILPMISKKSVKFIHAFITLSAFVCVIIGLVAIFSLFSFKSQQVTSLHSWIGLTAVLLFAMQWVVGFVTFLVPGVSGKVKSGYLPFHQWMGVGTLGVAIAAILTGMMEEVGSLDAFSGEDLLTKFLALFLIFFGLVVGFIVCYPPFSRVPEKPTGEHIPLKE